MVEAMNMWLYGAKLTNSDSLCFSLYFMKFLLLIVFPPLGVWMDQHNKNYPDINKIAISFVLTAFFYFPGLFYALNNVTLN
jgi:uncharacterized membrane protein YqaE (UPF0057 family)